MAKYKVIKNPISIEGRLYQKGDVVEMTEKEAKAIGEELLKKEVAKTKKKK